MPLKTSYFLLDTHLRTPSIFFESPDESSVSGVYRENAIHVTYNGKRFL